MVSFVYYHNGAFSEILFFKINTNHKKTQNVKETYVKFF